MYTITSPFTYGGGDYVHLKRSSRIFAVVGPEIMAPYGEVVTEDRIAVITRASGLERLWTRMTGDFEFMELCEFSFSEEVTL